MLPRTSRPEPGPTVALLAIVRLLSVPLDLLEATPPAAFAAFTTATARSVFAPLFRGADRTRDAVAVFDVADEVEG